VIHHNSLP